MEDEFHQLNVDERVALTHQARALNRPLLIRWQEIRPGFGEAWQYRAATAARWLARAKSVADLGCGAHTLERHLAPSQAYNPVDLAQRDPRTIVIDFNEPSQLESLPTADACALLGTLEYVYQPVELLKAISRKYGSAVLSFNTSTARQTLNWRLAQGWVNHFTRSEIRQTLRETGFTIRKAVRFRRRDEYIFDLRSPAQSNRAAPPDRGKSAAA